MAGIAWPILLRSGLGRLRPWEMTASGAIAGLTLAN
jgi:hypothetical protein